MATLTERIKGQAVFYFILILSPRFPGLFSILMDQILKSLIDER